MKLNSKKFKVIGLVILIILTIMAIILSLLLGYIKIHFFDLVEAYKNFNNTTAHIVIRDSRMPRTLIALFVGGSLGISGVLIQALTKNPMASPSLIGINSGASFFLVFTMSFFPQASQDLLTLVSFLGTALASFIVYVLAGGLKGEMQTIDLTLSGAAISALFLSLTQGILYKDQRTMEEILFWLSGSVDGRSIDSLFKVLPYLISCWIIPFVFYKKLNIFSLGEEMAKGLGEKTELLKLFIGIVIIILSGASVAIAGPISLIGLITPHIVKAFLGESEYQWIIPYSAFIGALLLIISDIFSRFIIYPKEIPVGTVTALIGAPFFIYLARKAENK